MMKKGNVVQLNAWTSSLSLLLCLKPNSFVYKNEQKTNNDGYCAIKLITSRFLWRQQHTAHVHHIYTTSYSQENNRRKTPLPETTKWDYIYANNKKRESWEGGFCLKEVIRWTRLHRFKSTPYHPIPSTPPTHRPPPASPPLPTPDPCSPPPKRTYVIRQSLRFISALRRPSLA